MEQITIYLPEDVARKTRWLAKRAGKSIPAYIVEIIARETSTRGWPEDLIDLLHQGKGDLAEPPDPPPEEIPSFE